jgi:hypothetical protein
MPKFEGVLATPIKSVRGSLLDTEESFNREYLRVLAERLDKLEALASHYGIKGKIDLPQALVLLVRLASETVPGFMEDNDANLKRPGKPKKHDSHSLFLLLARVEALRLDGLDDTAACQAIAAEDDSKLAGIAHRSEREARGKTLQNLLPKARAQPFASALAAMAQNRSISDAEYDALRFGAVDAASFVTLEKIIARVSGSTPEN